jgi:PAS domain S-box-containing protein
VADQQKKHDEAVDPAAELQRLARLLTKAVASESRDDKAHVPSYGDLADINACRLLTRAVPAELLTAMVEDCVRLLDTSAAVCEKNGDYALAIFSSDWCRLLDQASRELCGTDDNREALQSGEWLCHESCWTQASKVCIETGQPVDIECHGGIRLFAAPIRAGDEIVGCMNFGYGDPPSASDKLQEIASKYRVSVDELREAADSYESRPAFLIDLARNHLLSSVRLMGEIVERKRAKKQLRRLATILTDSNDAITVQNLDGAILAWNRGAERIYGYTEQEALGMNVRELLPEPQRAEANDFIDQIRSGQLGESLEMQRQTKDGRILDVWLTLTALTDETGKPTAVATTERDITERKRAEQRIRGLNAELQQRIVELSAVNKELEAFSYSVSHDLRAPLRGIDGFSRMLLEDHADQLGTEGRRRLNVIRSSAEQMAQLIDDLLAFSRLGRKHMSSSRINMSALAKEVFAQLQLDGLGQAVHLRIGALPHADGDRAMIRGALWNLLSNAVKFTGPRKVPVIELAGEVRADENAYSVRDNGVGFDMKYANKLFQVFQRLHDAEEFEGTGIGLALVQRVVHRHGGRVWAEAKTGEGATFHFTLPRRKESQDA